LEPVGAVAPLNTLTNGALAEGLVNLRKSTELLLAVSFFRTKDMKQDLDRTAFRGVLPILQVFLARAGYEVTGVRYFEVLPDGTASTSGALSGTGGRPPGVCVTFRAGPDRPEQRVHYVQADISDGGLKKHPELVKWMDSFGTGTGYLKAASYLMHEAYFSGIRSFLLGHCDVLVQDDSGIPLRFFPPEAWELRLFGRFEAPIELFKGKPQPDLVEAYRRAGEVAPLPFGTGYRHRPGDSNLMIARRK
jgi:hypothetical protein